MAMENVGDHFEGKDPLEHIQAKRTEGMHTAAEGHGSEIQSHLGAAMDGARETSVVVILLWTFFLLSGVTPLIGLLYFFSFGLGWLAWKVGRSAWLGYRFLERYHRVIEQEKYEIEHHRGQEREELVALYGAKGFEGNLLDDVVDTLMADNDRLLKVMLEEEMGLTLQAFEHPLKQALGAGIGTALALVICGLAFFISPFYGTPLATVFVLGAGGLFTAYAEKNQIIPAVIWNLSLGVLAFGITFFVFKLCLSFL